MDSSVPEVSLLALVRTRAVNDPKTPLVRRPDHPMTAIDFHSTLRAGRPVAEVAKPARNSHGAPLYPTAPGTDAFWLWFASSKVVDALWRPLVVYHGTATSFDAFDPSARPVNDDGYLGAGSYFETDPARASQYAMMAADAKHGFQTDDEMVDAQVVPVYLCIRNPYRIIPGGLDTYGMERQQVHEWTENLKRLGFDGVQAGTEWVAFYPEQIKSATGNDGTFDPLDSSLIGRDHPCRAIESAPRERARMVATALAAGDQPSLKKGEKHARP